MSKLGKILHRQDFYPSFIGLFTNPFYFARRALLTNIKELAPQIGGKTLDVGCGTKPYAELFKNVSWVGLEVDTPGNRQAGLADAFYDGKNFPFFDKEFDSAISSEVLEHVFEPEIFIKELNRILKTNGTLLLTTPFMWQEHEQPYDFGRYSSFGLKAILERNGFEIIEQRKTLGDFRAITQLLNCQIRKFLPLKNKALKLLCSIILFGASNILGTILSFILPKNEAFYIDNVVLARKNK